MSSAAEYLINCKWSIWKRDYGNILTPDNVMPGQLDGTIAAWTGEQQLVYEYLIVALEDLQWSYTLPLRPKKLFIRQEVEDWFAGDGGALSLDTVTAYLQMDADWLRKVVKRASAQWALSDGKIPVFKHRESYEDRSISWSRVRGDRGVSSCTLGSETQSDVCNKEQVGSLIGLKDALP